MGTAPGTAQHQYQTCDGGCGRYICRVNPEGRSDGQSEGYERGEADGYVQGYQQALADGSAR